MRFRGLAIVLALLLAPPVATADEPFRGDLDARGDITAPPGTRVTARPAAVFAGDLSTLRAFTLRAPRLVVDEYWIRYAEIQAPGERVQFATGTGHDTYVVSDTTVTLDDRTSVQGWLALTRVARWDGIASGTFSASPSAGADFGNGGPGGGDEQPYFSFAREGDWLLLEGALDQRASGPLTVKMSGPDLVVTARENTTRLHTGASPRPEQAGSSEVRWVILRAEQGTLDIEGTVPTIAAASEADLTWDGLATIAGARGVLTGPDATFVAGGERGALDGAFHAVLTVATSTRAATMHLAVDGDLRGTTFAVATTRTVVPPRARGPLFLLAASAALAAVAVAGAWLARPRRAAEPCLEADDCLDLAHLALELGHHADALMWVRRARALSPASGSLALEEGWVHLAASRPAEARHAFEEARRMTPDRGDATLALAWLDVASAIERAEASIVEALARSPALLLDVEDDDALAELRSRPAVRAAIERARRKLA